MIARHFASALLSATLLAGAAASVEAKDWKTVTVVTEGAYEPWNLTNPDGTVGGFEPEMLKDLCGRMKIECKVVTSDFDSAIPSLVAGKYDVVMDALSITDDRKKTIAFSDPYAATPAVFVTDKTSPLANAAGTGTTIKLENDGATPTMDALRKAFKGKTIGIQTATVYTPFVINNFKDVATIREYKTSPEHDLDLVAGRIDLAFDDATYFTSAFAKPENKDMAYTGPQINGMIWGPGEAFGFRKEDTDLTAMFNKAITEAKADGTLEKLSQKWFKLNVVP
ncbi:transporter substrate-binding domain-containing protein [Lichenihabitans sp. Uapishka_5]|uniref:transporter substrate-binding domain-containing protein n=1 Tax=Lichenihabitans sp. Uapishka_5 TaxID=3037302 RepID=UPI0029E7FEB8|nr:transporter substrate-binding domain-containing protein [Lichenihabitans sp. Uapishka_5]MDX7952703.1 transporter substrate-binding domain-containing protein [Lichenihabitans sp. Uapishka_5]